ncbi:MAG: SURF1 family protein [Marmoricola sp.]
MLLHPRYWGAHVLLLVALAVTIGLGVWQWGVWSGDRTDASRTLVHARPVALSSVLGPDGVFPGDGVGRPVRLTGRWLGRDTLYVSHRLLHGRNGYWVMTPVRVGRSAIPVVRGWSPRPQAAPVSGRVRVTGWLQPSETQGEADADPTDDVIGSMRIASMTQDVKVDLYSGFVVSRDASSGTSGLSAIGPATPPKVSIWTGLRNLLYACQWWVFSGFATYIWWRWCRDQLHPREHPAEGSGDADRPATDPERQHQ